MPLQNRVDPFGGLIAVSARGTLFGNRGGRFHRDDRTLGQRRWASRQWICCELEFKRRRRSVWSAGYTELFFLDEVTAFATGHRPCFECRRPDAISFADHWARARRMDMRPSAPEVDRVLHAERLDGRLKRRHQRAIELLPDGAFVVLEGQAWAIRGNALLRWTPVGYDTVRTRLRGTRAECLTPPAILAVLSAGYRPRWHESALKESGPRPAGPLAAGSR